MTKLSRRSFLATAAATAGSQMAPRAIAPVAKSAGGRRILTLVYDKSLGMMRAVERIVPKAL